MNRSNFQAGLSRAVTHAKVFGAKAVAVGSGLAISGLALADEAADVTAIIDAQKTLALAVVVAGTIAMLAIKYSKMARRA